MAEIELDQSRALSHRVWELKYRAPGENGWEDTARRVAGALAQNEPHEQELWSARFEQVLRSQTFLPAGRILAVAGTKKRATLLNCFVLAPIDDSMDGIFSALKDTALTLQEGGGVGVDFSTLRPRGMRARDTGNEASGPVSFMRIWDASSEVLFSTGPRRGAMMATLRCDHPDILEFIHAKKGAGALRNFNLSVQVTDAFLGAVAHDEVWPLVFPDTPRGDGTGEWLLRRWSGTQEEVPCRVVRRIPARTLWRALLQSSWDTGEPGVLFVDTIARENNLGYREHISATNPCGEEPLPPNGACDLGSLNLVQFVRQPFSAKAAFDFEAAASVTHIAVRMLEDALDVTHFPLPAQAQQAKQTRRVGLGITGLADALAMLLLPYDLPRARDTAARILQTVRDAAYQTSCVLAATRGPFPAYERDRFLDAPFVRRLPEELRAAISRWGIRNSHLLAIAPAGSISLLASNVSGGVEPVFALTHRRRLLEQEGAAEEFTVQSYALRLWRALKGSAEPPARVFVDSRTLEPNVHLLMQAALQPFVDGAISKTVNVPLQATFEAFESLFMRAHALGLKGCTVFRTETVRGSVLEPVADGRVECCQVETAA